LRVEVERASSRSVVDVPLQRGTDHLGVVEQGRQLLVGLGEVEGRAGSRDVLAALAVDPDPDGVLLVDVELEPGAAAGDDLGGVDVAVGGLVEAWSK